MNEFSGKTFGLLIAFVLPGFGLLYGLQPVSPLLQQWLATDPSIPARLESVFFVALASTGAGMTVSAVRWLLVDSLHRATGLRRPSWDDARLQSNLQAFEALVEAHYRYYQFYANSLIASSIVLVVALATDQPWARSPAVLSALAFFDGTFFLMSRDTLRNYYRRTERLLQFLSPRKEVQHGKRPRPRQTAQSGKADQ